MKILIMIKIRLNSYLINLMGCSFCQEDKRAPEVSKRQLRPLSETELNDFVKKWEDGKSTALSDTKETSNKRVIFKNNGLCGLKAFKNNFLQKMLCPASKKLRLTFQ